jgi:hypothetical protein
MRIAQTFEERQKLLMRAIDQGIKSHGIVIPFVGGTHLFGDASLPKTALQSTNAFLATRKFVIVIWKKIRMNITPVFKSNPEFWKWEKPPVPGSLSISQILRSYILENDVWEAAVKPLRPDCPAKKHLLKSS